MGIEKNQSLKIKGRNKNKNNHKNMPEKDPLEGMKEVKSPQVKWGKIGDWFKGTLVDNTKQIENKLSAKHEMQLICEFKMKGGSFHDIVNKIPVENATEILDEEFYTLFAKGMVKSRLEKVKIGQIVGLRFTKEVPPSIPGHNPTKIIDVRLGDMDPEYQGETSVDINSVK